MFIEWIISELQLNVIREIQQNNWIIEVGTETNTKRNSDQSEFIIRVGFLILILIKKKTQVLSNVIIKFFSNFE